MKLEEHMRRAMAFSRATYGPGERTQGLIDHIGKELKEVENNPDFGIRSQEWVDVVILGLDAMWRALHAEGVPWDEIPERIASDIAQKQTRNENRDWPDWRTVPKDKAIEHVSEEPCS